MTLTPFCPHCAPQGHCHPERSEGSPNPIMALLKVLSLVVPIQFYTLGIMTIEQDKPCKRRCGNHVCGRK